MKPRLFTYTIPIDDGSAPNPFNGLCTLAICKPAIRRVAQVNDWVAGFGSVNAPSGDLSGRLVYAMRIEQVLPIREYDELAPARWPHRIPDIHSKDLSERLGDCIYDYSSAHPVQRKSVHGSGNMDIDLKGENVLISSDFYYFGNRAKPVPEDLRQICHQTQGHRSDSNAPFFDKFVSWIFGMGLVQGQLYGWPDYIIDWEEDDGCKGCQARIEDGNMDG